MKRAFLVLGGAALLALVGACTGRDINGGSNSAVDAGPDAGSSLSGTYKGYFELFTFPDGSDSVAMTLNFATDGTVTGTVFFGGAPLLAPPTDPSVAYPPGYPNPSPTLEGFNYSVFAGTYVGSRLQLQIQPGELWKQWCELQTSFPWALEASGHCFDPDAGAVPKVYTCLPEGSVQWGTPPGTSCTIMPCAQPTSTPIDCGKADLCGYSPNGFTTCTCSASGCTVPPNPKDAVAFDMQLSDGVLTGSGTVGGVFNVRMTKQ